MSTSPTQGEDKGRGMHIHKVDRMAAAG